MDSVLFLVPVGSSKSKAYATNKYYILKLNYTNKYTT